MVDRNHRDFYGRLYRIQKTHRRGGGFEAAGTLGRAYFVPRIRRRIPVIGPVLILLAAILCLKAIILSGIGPQTYEARLAGLRDGGLVERIGALVMTPDPATVFLAARVSSLHLLR